jgi:hypothetical protein
MSLLDFAPSLARPAEHLRDTGRYRVDRSERPMRGIAPRHHLTMTSDHLVIGFAVWIRHRPRLPAALERVATQFVPSVIIEPDAAWSRGITHRLTSGLQEQEQNRNN